MRVRLERRSEPAALREPAAHRAGARHLRVIVSVLLPQPGDRRGAGIPAREACFGLTPQAGPGVRSRPGAHDRAAGRANGRQVGLERARSLTRQTALRIPDARERDDEIPAGVAAHELDGVVTLAERELDAVREFPQMGTAARAIETDSADRRLHRHATALVQRWEAGHARRLPAPPRTALSRAVTGPCHRPNGTRRACHLAACAVTASTRRPCPIKMIERSGRVDNLSAPRPATPMDRPCRRILDAKWHTPRVPFGEPNSAAAGGLELPRRCSARQQGRQGFGDRRSGDHAADGVRDR